MNSHPTRKKLIGAARGSSTVPKEHLADCSWCHLYFALLTKYQLAGELPFTNAPQAWIDKAVLIAAKSGRWKGLKKFIAGLSFDSWSGSIPEGVRGEAMLQERRLLFESGHNLFDLRAERRRNRWDFTAQITDRQGKTIDCTLLAGTKELSADELGFYQWSSVKPPQKFELITEAGVIVIPELSWKKSRAE